MSMKPSTTPPLNIVWFRQDLRLQDNPALTRAAAAGTVLPVYILDDENAADWAMGGASRWWLHHSLLSLNRSLQGRLLVVRGNALKLLPRLARQHQARAVFWNRCYEPWRQRRDALIKQALQQDGIQVDSSNGSLLWEPWEVLKPDRTPYRVFTPYYRNGCLAAPTPALPLPVPPSLRLAQASATGDIDSLSLLPRIKWYETMAQHWQPGESAAAAMLNRFLLQGLHNYRDGRDFPGLATVSRLSPFLHHGEISPRQVWHASLRAAVGTPLEYQMEHFQRELVWREFSYYLLYHSPSITEQNLQPKFDRFPWRQDAESLTRWQHGLTGYPIVDAGMRELWQTGYMHNRVRMIVASFLVKNLMIHWRAGQRWFWDCLVDADLANNSASWQWVAGSGADAAPYFRIFNPVTQGMKFDASGNYVRRFVPEIAALPDRYLHDPGRCPDAVLAAAGIKLDRDYPNPVVDLASSRQRALTAFAALKEPL